MISKLSDSANMDLLNLIEAYTRISAKELTEMKDEDVLAIFLKLSFQRRVCVGVGPSMTWDADTQIRNIESELANIELLEN